MTRQSIKRFLKNCANKFFSDIRKKQKRKKKTYIQKNFPQVVINVYEYGNDPYTSDWIEKKQSAADLPISSGGNLKRVNTQQGMLN